MAGPAGTRAPPGGQGHQAGRERDESQKRQGCAQEWALRDGEPKVFPGLLPTARIWVEKPFSSSFHLEAQE